MEWDAIELNWDRIAPLARARFAVDLTATAGKRDALNKRVAANFGISEQEAAHQTQEWALRLEADPEDVQPRPMVAPRGSGPELGTLSAPQKPKEVKAHGK